MGQGVHIFREEPEIRTEYGRAIPQEIIIIILIGWKGRLYVHDDCSTIENYRQW